MNPVGAWIVLLLGGLLILVPVLVQGFISVEEAKQVGEFYARTGPNASLPDELRKSAHGAFHWASFGMGAALIWVAIGMMRSAPPRPAGPA